MNSSIHIKNMVCNRCIKVVKEELEKLGYKLENVSLGEVVIDEAQKKINRDELSKILLENGFELLDDRNARIIEKIKLLIIDVIHYNKEDLSKINFPKYLSEELHINYSQLSTLFSSMEGITLEKFIINQKIEKVKELLTYDELTLTEISYRLGYSSVQHLSNQFKQVTGLTPKYFKKHKELKRTPLDKLG